MGISPGAWRLLLISLSWPIRHMPLWGRGPARHLLWCRPYKDLFLGREKEDVAVPGLCTPPGPHSARCRRAWRKGCNCCSISNELVVLRRAPNKRSLCGRCTKASWLLLKSSARGCVGQAGVAAPWHGVNVRQGSGRSGEGSTDVCRRSSPVCQHRHSPATTNNSAAPKRAFSGPPASLAETNRKLFPSQRLK